MKWVFVLISFVYFHGVNSFNVPIQSRIVNGNPVNINSYPFMVSVQVNNRHSCGGTILNQNYILTAAHCIKDLKASQMSITHGSNYPNEGKRHQVVTIDKSLYNYDTLKNDLAVLKISPPIKFTQSSQPVRILNADLSAGSAVEVIGWGKVNEKETNNINFNKRPLLGATVNIVTVQTCNDVYKDNFGLGIGGTQICAAAKSKDSCQGDSGGPLIDKKSGKQVGIASFGYGCAMEGFPGVYTLVYKFNEFLKKYST